MTGLPRRLARQPPDSFLVQLLVLPDSMARAWHLPNEYGRADSFFELLLLLPMDMTLLWIPATLAAAAAQTARNATQRGLTEIIGTVGATQVRFLYGFPFALLFLGIVAGATGEGIAMP